MKIWTAALIAIPLLTTPCLARSEMGFGTGIGALSGALVGSLSGPNKNRMENTLIGAVAGGVLGSAIASRPVGYHANSYQETSWGEPQYVVQPVQRVVITQPLYHTVVINREPVYYERLTPRRHHWRDHRRHHRNHHWRNWD